MLLTDDFEQMLKQQKSWEFANGEVERRRRQEMQMYNQWQSEPIVMSWDNNTMTKKSWYTSQDSQCQTKPEEPWRCTCEQPDHKLRLMAYRIKFLKSTGKHKEILGKFEGAKVCCIFKELKRLKIIT